MSYTNEFYFSLYVFLKLKRRTRLPNSRNEAQALNFKEMRKHNDNKY